MPAYLNVTFNHLAAVQQWVGEHAAEAFLDMQDHTLHVHCRGRACRMYPMFQGVREGQYFHLAQLTADVSGFGGWRPYRTLTHPHTQDKLLFKRFLADAGLRAPTLFDQGATPGADYVLKARHGSFGDGLAGPFRAGTPPPPVDGWGPGTGGAFAEQFVAGRMLKVWYWGARPFFAHMQDYPCVEGDGERDAATLVHDEFAAVGVDPRKAREWPFVLACLAYQGIAPDTVLPAGRKAWIDYRYNRLYTAGAMASRRRSDNALDALQEAAGAQLQAMGEALDALLRRTLEAPVAITADGLLDEAGQVWWLEMNTNSLLPPEAYAVMFADIFPSRGGTA